jgi:hypothetical protein
VAPPPGHRVQRRHENAHRRAGVPVHHVGKPSRLREPFVVNDYAGPYRTVVFWIDGTLYMPRVLYNDDCTWYFADIGVTIPAGTMYTTDEPQPGEVLKYKAASGPDPAKFWRTAAVRPGPARQQSHPHRDAGELPDADKAVRADAEGRSDHRRFAQPALRGGQRDDRSGG